MVDCVRAVKHFFNTCFLALVVLLSTGVSHAATWTGTSGTACGSATYTGISAESVASQFLTKSNSCGGPLTYSQFSLVFSSAGDTAVLTVKYFVVAVGSGFPIGSSGTAGTVLITRESTSDDTLCANAALLDSTAFGKRDVQIPGLVSSGDACMPVAGSSPGSGCKIAFSRQVSYKKNDIWISEGTYSYPGATSAACSIGGSPRPAEPDTCKGGQPGQVNGVTVCVPFSKEIPTVSDTKKDSSTTSPGGTETKSETKTTTCDNGSCNTTTTTTTTNSSGTSVTNNTTTQSKGEYCAATPGAKECTGESAFAGDCAAGFTYDGDAIQGAIAKEVYNQNCIWNKVTSESAQYDAAKDKTGNQTTDLPGNETVAISSTSFDKSNALGAGSCISNLTLNVLGSTVILPLSNICPWLAYFRYILLAVGFFMAYRIVFGK